MGLYSERALPWFIERVMSLPEVRAQRLPSLAGARGRVLEIGFGCGSSLDAYPQEGLELVGLDPNPGMLRRAAARTARAPFRVELVQAGAERIPLPDQSFDTVVSHWTLCSLNDRAGALREVRRVLRPGGRLLFLEHGRAEESRLARWQRYLSPLQSLLAGGCRLDVPVALLIESAGFEILELARYEAKPGPRVATQMYRGSARAAGA